MKKLNKKQERFCLEYVIDLNATQAAIRAGYSKKTAHSSGPRLLENVDVKAKIEELQAKTTKKLEITREDIVSRLNARSKTVEQLHILATKEKLTPQEESQFARLTMVIKTSDANKADEVIAKMLGFNAPDKLDVEHRGIEKININIIKNK